MKLSEWEGEEQSDDDLTRKLVSCNVLAQVRESPPKPVLISRISAQLDPVTGRAYDGVLVTDRTRGEWIKRSELDIITTIPPSGIYQVGKSVAMLRRNPLRQWSEGTNPHTCVIMIDNKIIPTFGWDLLDAIFSKQQDIRTLKEGKEELKGKNSIRLDKSFWLKTEDKNVSLFRGVARIGSWAFDKFYWSPDGRILQEEVIDRFGAI